ncbi:MAG: dihydropteroate synthase [Anaerolineales bacterium]|nr:dihydropteroate synthase [Anaerolineales bacterium]MBS3751781.1 dihydropteroate synthase [Anaerolineales bacterium]
MKKVIEHELSVGDFLFRWGKRTYVMGILNVTPDSFSGDGLVGKGMEGAVEQARAFVKAGVDILDVGGESTRPGADPVSVDEELNRVLPVIDRLSDEFETVISIDTYKALVAEKALARGADLVNDVWGLRADPELKTVISEHQVPVILMHNRSDPSNAQIKEQLGGRYVGVEYEDLLQDVKRELMESVQVAREAGIPEKHIILDPGIGFGKTVNQNLELLNRLDEIRGLGYPVLLGPSRKSFIGYTLDLPPEERVEGTAATVSIGIARGADIVRVHDVAQMTRVAKMTDAIVRGG